MRAALDCNTNSPFRHLSKCKEDSIENMHTDVRVFIGLTKLENFTKLHYFSSWFFIEPFYYGNPTQKVKLLAVAFTGSLHQL